MTEKKLYDAAAKMPLAETSFEDIILRQHKTAPVRRRWRLRPGLIALVLIAVFTLGAGAYRYGQIQRTMWVVERYSNYVMPTHNAWEKSQQLLEPFDCVLPQSLMGYDFECGIRYSVVPKGVSQMEAFFTKFYNPVDFTYSILVPDEDGYNTNRLSFVDVTIGTTHDYWHYYFSMDENQVWSNENALPETIRTEEYRGYQLQAATRLVEESDSGESFEIHTVVWVDEARQVCFHLSIGRTESLDFLMDFAKAIIDMNS